MKMMTQNFGEADEKRVQILSQKYHYNLQIIKDKMRRHVQLRPEAI